LFAGLSSGVVQGAASAAAGAAGEPGLVEISRRAAPGNEEPN
jgi:hypothetical protein